MSFIDFIHKHKLKNEATSKLTIQQVHSSLSLSDVGIYSRDGLFSSDIGIVKLHPSKGTHWVLYMNEIFLIHMVVQFLKNYLKLL